MRTLLFCQIVFGAIIAFGPTLDGANRVAGLASVAVSMVISSAIALTSDRRELKLGLLALMTTALTFVAFRYAEPISTRSLLVDLGVSLTAADAANHLLPRHLLGLAVAPPALFLAALVSHRTHPAWLRVAWLLGSATGFAMIVLSDSRDAAIAFLAGVVVLVGSVLVARRSLVLVLAAIAAAGAALTVLSILRDDLGLRGREELWALGLRHMVASPVLGLGYGGLSAIYRREAPGLGTNAHNLVVQVLSDFGVTGLIILALAAVQSVRVAVRDSRVSLVAFRGFVACVAFVAVAGIAESIIDATQHFPATDVTIVLPLLFAVLAVPLRAGSTKAALPQTRRG